MYYFGYGSNMNETRVIKREMPFTQILGGTLHNYQLAFNKRSVKYPGAASANVVEAKGSHVQGVLYKLRVKMRFSRWIPLKATQ